MKQEKDRKCPQMARSRNYSNKWTRKHGHHRNIQNFNKGNHKFNNNLSNHGNHSNEGYHRIRGNINNKNLIIFLIR